VTAGQTPPGFLSVHGKSTAGRRQKPASRGPGTPDIIFPRMLRWSIMLNAYTFKLVHKPGAQLGNADALSRFSRNASQVYIPNPPEVLFIEELPSPPLTVNDVAQLTMRDPQLGRVLNWDRQLIQDTQLAASNEEQKFEPNEAVYIRTYETGPPWVPAIISKPTGPVSYEATTQDGKPAKRHADLIQKRSPENSPNGNVASPPSPVQAEKATTPQPDPSVPSRPKRIRNRPAYLKDYVC
ncbi:hypothetical protein TTRE_0000778701, partial [Trichuris trichiura]